MPQSAEHWTRSKDAHVCGFVGCVTDLGVSLVRPQRYGYARHGNKSLKCSRKRHWSYAVCIVKERGNGTDPSHAAFARVPKYFDTSDCRQGHAFQVAGDFRGIDYALVKYRSIVNNSCSHDINVVTCNQLLRKLCDANRTMEAMSLFTKMRSQGGCIRPTVVTYSTLISRVVPRRKKSKKTTVSAVIRKSRCVESDELLFQTALSDHASRVWDLYEALREDELAPDVVVFNSIMSAAAAAGSAALAWRAFKEMMSLSVPPNTRTMNQMLDAVGNDPITTVQDIEVVLQDFSRLHIERDVVTFSTLCDIYADSGDAKHVIDLVAEMRERGLQPNARTWSSVVRAFCAQGDVSRGHHVLKTLLRNRAQKRTLADNVSVHMYTVLVDAYGKQGNLKQCVELLSDMVERGYPPNAHTYSSLIHSCGKFGAPELMLEILYAMQRAGVRPNEVTYSSIVHYAGKAGVSIGSASGYVDAKCEKLIQKVRKLRACNLREDCSRERIHSDDKMHHQKEQLEDVPRQTDFDADERISSIQDSNIDQLAVVPDDTAQAASDRAGDVEASASAADNECRFGDFNNFGVDERPADEQQYLSLLNSFAYKNELMQSFLVLGEMKRRGLNTKKAYNALLGVCCRVNDFGAAVSAFEAMRTDGVEPDVTSYTNLVWALFGDKSDNEMQQRRLLRVFLIFLEMQSAGVAPDLVFMNAMINACRECGAPEKAKEVFASIERLGLVPDAASYTSLLLACLESSDFVHALRVFKRMSTSGYSVADTTRAALAGGLSKIAADKSQRTLIAAELLLDGPHLINFRDAASLSRDEDEIACALRRFEGNFEAL